MKTLASQKRIWLQVSLPILGLVAACIVGAFGVFWALSDRQDRAFEQDSSLLVRSALTGRQHALSNSVLDFAFWNDAYRSVSLDWNEAWVTENFVSSAADAIVIFNTDQQVRHVWRTDEMGGDARALGALVTAAAGTMAELLRAAASAQETDRVVNRYAVFDGRLLLMSIAPMGWEEAEALRLGRAPPTDFVVCIDALDPEELTALGDALGLQQLEFIAGDGVDNQGALQMPLGGHDGSIVGRLAWVNERPGTQGFAGQITPIILGLFLLGAMALWVARNLAARQIAAMAGEEAALKTSRLKSEFIAAMSHELRTPLNAIIGYSELIAEELEAANFDERNVKADAARITAAGKHLLKLVNDILQHSRIDAKSQPVALADVDVAGALSQAVDVVAPLARANGNTLTVLVEDAAEVVRADPTLLTQCLINLAGNAAKFTRNGRIDLRARCELRTDRAYVVIDIADTGIGIDSAEIPRLFAPFQQANEAVSREYGGAGLGLSITRKLARSMGGEVSVVSEPGVGSTFSLALPAAAAAYSHVRLVA